MDARTVLTAAGSGLATGLVVVVLVIEALDVEFSALVGVPVGVVAGVVVLVAVATTANGRDPSVRRALSAYAAFGLALLGLAALSYVNLAAGLLSTVETVGVAIGVVVLVSLGLWCRERPVR
jgi:hypothetical protein